MGSKKGHRRSKEREETGTAKECEHGELAVQNQGSVDVSGREGKRKEKKRKVNSGDVLDDVEGKGCDYECNHGNVEKEERKKDAKEKHRQKKRKIEVDELQGERGDADVGGHGSDIRKRKNGEKDKKKKIQKIENLRDEEGCADFVRVELDDCKVEEDMKETKKKKRIAERHPSNGIQQIDVMVQAEEVEVEKRKENKKKRKKNKTKGERQFEEKQDGEETDGARKKGLGRYGEKGKPGIENNGGSNVEGEEQGEFELDAHLVPTEVQKKGKRVKKGEKKKKKAEDTTSFLEGNSPERMSDDILITNSVEGTPGKAASKRVTFAENIEVFPFGDSEQNMVVGQRYTKEEDELLKQAVHHYIESHGLGETGVEMILHCRRHKIKGCWTEIGKSLPWRNRASIYQRVHTMFERPGDKPNWGPEDQELIMQYYKEHGSSWKKLADALGKYRYDIKDMFRLLNHGQLKKGKWMPEELDNLYELVNKDLRMGPKVGKKTNQGMFRDNIPWTSISEQLATRGFAACCHKWYRIASPMVSQGKWTDSDDYRLVDALVKLDAYTFMEVDWDNLLEHRAGDLCLRRWKELVRSVGRHYSKTFLELVEILSKRYAWDILEAKEATVDDDSDAEEAS